MRIGLSKPVTPLCRGLDQVDLRHHHSYCTKRHLLGAGAQRLQADPPGSTPDHLGFRHEWMNLAGPHRTGAPFIAAISSR